MIFQDHFSRQAADYAKFRPEYPAPLFRYLADVSPQRNLAWDCATGSGQCAVALAPFFKHVIATDASENQIRYARPNPGVEYRVATAEKSGLTTGSIDLLTVAQALHWFDLDPFFREAKRVLERNGVVAVWSYNLLRISPEIDATVNHFYNVTVGSFWPFQRKFVEEGYRSVSFPFEEMDVPAFAMEARWSMGHLVGYLRTWSATQAFIAAKHTDPIEAIMPALLEAWSDPNQERRVVWPLSVRVGRHLSENS